MSKPIVIEFTGTPEAGKTSTMKLLIDMLEKQKIKVGFVNEAASKIKQYLPNSNSNHGLWIVASTVKELLEELDKPNDVIIVDRGLLDRLFWNIFSYTKKDITLEEKSNRDSLILNPKMPLKSDMLVVLTIPAEESIKRKGKEGKFVTLDNVNLYNDCLNQFIGQVNNFSENTKIVQICTLNLDKNLVAEKIYDSIIELLAKGNSYLINFE